MYSRKIRVLNKTGLHARPASIFVQKAGEFKANIYLIKNNKKVNAKGIINILSLGIAKGTELEIEAEGIDEKKAVDTLFELINSKFGEE